jgi:zinc protease
MIRIKSEVLVMKKFLFIYFLCSAALAQGVDLVTPSAIKLQENLTRIGKLSNGIKVVYRQDNSSPLMHVVVNFEGGIREFSGSQRSDLRLLMGVMSEATKKLTRSQIHGIVEKYALRIGCSAGIESSSCEMGATTEYWRQGFSLLTDVVLNPALNKDDLNLRRERFIFGLKSNMQDPGRYSNEVVNNVFYGKNHPYFTPSDQIIAYLEKSSVAKVTKIHQKLINSKRIRIVVVGSLPYDRVIKDLEIAFGKMTAKDYLLSSAKAPVFNPKKAVAFENREIPTAYIRVKFNGLPIGHKDEVAMKLMMRIFDEELSDEIRTKRSLSYAIYSYMIQQSQGIGVIGASTSNPRETLEAMALVIKRMKTQKIPAKDLEEHKTIYATNYFLTQEKHSSLAGAISSNYFYRGDLSALYQLPLRLKTVTSADVQRVAQTLLLNLRVGVVYDGKKYDPKWATNLIKSTR